MEKTVASRSKSYPPELRDDVCWEPRHPPQDPLRVSNHQGVSVRVPFSQCTSGEQEVKSVGHDSGLPLQPGGTRYFPLRLLDLELSNLCTLSF